MKGLRCLVPHVHASAYILPERHLLVRLRLVEACEAFPSSFSLCSCFALPSARARRCKRFRAYRAASAMPRRARQAGRGRHAGGRRAQRHAAEQRSTPALYKRPARRRAVDWIALGSAAGRRARAGGLAGGEARRAGAGHGAAARPAHPGWPAVGRQPRAVRARPHQRRGARPPPR